MARIRTIKPDFFTSDDICALSPLARLLYIGLWCEADREGRLAWAPRTFKRRYLPDDDCDIEKLCRELLSRDLVRVYGGGDFAYIPTFLAHQHINPREGKSEIPPPDSDASARVPDASVTRREEGKEGREGKESSEAKASDADAASVVFKQGLAWLMKAAGKPEAHCRAQLGKWRKVIGDESLIAALGRGQREGPIDAMAWMERAVAATAKGPPKTYAEKAQDVAGMTVDRDGASQWQARLRTYKPGGFWLEHDWGPRPESGSCRAPRELVEAWTAKTNDRKEAA